MPTDIPFPPVSNVLVERLQELFRDRVPDIDTPEREVWARVGEQRVIRFLAEQVNKQAKNVLLKS